MSERCVSSSTASMGEEEGCGGGGGMRVEWPGILEVGWDGSTAREGSGGQGKRGSGMLCRAEVRISRDQGIITWRAG